MTPAIQLGDRITYRVPVTRHLVRDEHGMRHRDDGTRHGVVTGLGDGYVVVCSEAFVTVPMDAIMDARRVG
jgi:hypothetical protein